MANLVKEPFQIIIYTETKKDNIPNLESFIIPIKYLTKCNNAIQLELEFKISDALEEYLNFLNKNIDLYSKVVIKIGNETKVLEV